MRRHRRVVLMDRVIPFLAAFVGLVALGGAVLVQLTSDARTQRLAQEMAELRIAVDALAQRTDAVAAEIPTPAPAGDDGTIDALLALQDRMNSLEQEWAESQVAAPAPAAVGDGTSAPFSASAGAAPAAVDPSWPTENCIPLGTRFMASPGEELAICQTPVVVKVSAITADNVLVDGTGVINETGSKPIPGSNCSLMVYTAEAEGFAELRVSCN